MIDSLLQFEGFFDLMSGQYLGGSISPMPAARLEGDQSSQVPARSNSRPGRIRGAIGGHEDADCALHNVVQFFLRRHVVQIANEAERYERAADKLDELEGCEIRIFHGKVFERDLAIDEILEQDTTAGGQPEEAAAERRHPVRDADEGAHCIDGLWRRNLACKPDPEAIEAVLHILAAGKDIFQREGDTLALLLDERPEQIFLILKVDVDRPLRDSCLAGDVVHAGAIEAQPDEGSACTFDDLPALGGIFASGETGGTVAGQRSILLVVLVITVPLNREPIGPTRP